MDTGQIKYSELTFQLIVESSPNAIVLVNKEGKISYINSQTEKLFGYHRTELIGKKVEQLIPERFIQQHPHFRDSFFAEPAVRAMGAGRELYALRKDGTEFPIEIGLNPVVTVDGTLVLASIIDITERKKAEERFRLVVESAPNAMLLINNEGKITLVNAQTELLFGYDRKELIGNKLELLIPERFRPQHPSFRNHFFQNLQTRPMGSGRDLFALRKDGSEVQVEIGLNPIETTEGSMVLTSIIDITARKQQEAMLSKQAELEVKNKELEQFAYIASHDLQEPLRTVSNYMQVFEEDYLSQLDEQAHTYLQSVKKATTRMSVLIKALLDYSQLGRNSVLVQKNIRLLIDDVISDLSNMIRQSNAQIEIGEMPELNIYETEMRQLFQNLISNAIKFTNPGITPVIKINATKKENHYLFSVADNGIGIAPVHFDRVFEIFQRLHSAEKFKGNGIGLANSKKITALHQGDIWLESTQGSGTTFYFTISSQLQ